MKHLSLLIAPALLLLTINIKAQTGAAKVYEEMRDMRTYMFSDPDPVPAPGRIYPYFYFSGYTNNAENRNWKMVVLENDYIKLYITPEIGGKVWGAVEKSTGHEFLYFNNVVKFRDIAMRGAWTSGGLEYNFGDIGHIPTCATPVDYVTRKYPDGSVSCVVGAIDLPSGSRWNVEILLHPDRAFFETITRWHNSNDMPVSYYHWMNAAAAARDDLEFIYPGSMHIGHDGGRGNWLTENGRDISFYKNNNFGFYKSYHVINSMTDYFGGYWHDIDFGFGHRGRYDEKPGKKLWIWGLSDQGMIWEDLLTDNDGQYIEFQAGKLFNQADEKSSLTPFKHREFSPYDTDVMQEMWFPMVGTEGMRAVSPSGILNVVGKDILLSALEPLNEKLVIEYEGKVIVEKDINLDPLDLLRLDNALPGGGNFRISVGVDRLYLESRSRLVDRPSASPDPAGSVYSAFVSALELEKQRHYTEAEKHYRAVLETDHLFIPAINRMASAYLRRMEPDSALAMINRSLSFDTYNGEANYILGVTALSLGDTVMAESGLAIAMADPAFRSAAATVMSRSLLAGKKYNDAVHYAQRALEYNSNNLEAFMIMAVAARKKKDEHLALDALVNLDKMDPLLHFTLFEKYMLSNDPEDLELFRKSLKSELPFESCLDLADSYIKMGCQNEALRVLETSPPHPIVTLWRAWLDKSNRDKLLKDALSADAGFVFPHRPETAAIIGQLKDLSPHWKLDYYLALIHLNRGNTSLATSLLESCGNQPEFAPFYIARSRLLKDDTLVLADLKRAVELQPEDWRAALELARFHISSGEPDKALFLEKYLADNPEQPAIGVTWANILLLTEKYNDCITFLKGYNVLPYEGATAARDIYHAAAIMEAIRLTRLGRLARAGKVATMAADWPRNLGSGRPYEVDERDITFLEALIAEKNNQQSVASGRYNKVAAYTPESQISPYTLLKILALESSGQTDEAGELLNKIENQKSKDPMAAWLVLMYKGDRAQAAGMEAIIEREQSLNGRIKAGVSETDIVKALVSLR